MATPEPDHFFDQADRLIVGVGAGAPRQVDLRRAVSAAYYGAFHSVVRATSDLFITATKRQSPIYGLVYRSIEHRVIRSLCEDITKQTLPAKYSPYVPRDGLGGDIKAFSAAFVELQKKRHSADYDPIVRLRRSDAVLAISTARAAVSRLAGAELEAVDIFLTLLVFPPRSQ